MWRYILGGDARVTHDGDAGAYFLILAGSFQLEGKSVVRTHLMTDLMHDVIYVEIVSHGDRISRRSDSASLLPVDTNTTNTSRIAATARSAEHVSNIVVRLPNDVS
jgi:hypothetical protein